MSSYKTNSQYIPEMRSASEAYHALRAIKTHGAIAYKTKIAQAALNQGVAQNEDEAVKIADQEYAHVCRIKNGYRLNEEANKELKADKAKETKGACNSDPLFA